MSNAKGVSAGGPCCACQASTLDASARHLLLCVPLHMVLVRISDSVWLEGPSVAAQNQQHEATKAQLAEAQVAASRLEGELAGLQAEYQAACSAKAELVKERTQLEKRVRRSNRAGVSRRGRCCQDASASVDAWPSGRSHSVYLTLTILSWLPPSAFPPA